MGRVDDHEDLVLTSYALVKTWILQRAVELKLRKNTRTNGLVKGPDDMVHGVNDAPPQVEQPSPQAARAPAVEATDEGRPSR